MTYHLKLCQGEQSEHIAVIGDGKTGKTSHVREKILKRLPPTYTYWCYDYNHNGFNGCGTQVKNINKLLYGNMQYLPQVKDRKECDQFVEAALRLGDRIVVLDEYHTQQNSKFISPLQARFLRTARHHNISWIVIAQSPLELHEAVYHNQDHIFAYAMAKTSRHIKWYYQWFGKKMTFDLLESHAIAVRDNKPRPYIYQKKGEPEARLYNNYVQKEGAAA